MASLINYALKACGLEKEDPEVQQAFIAGLKYGNQETAPARKWPATVHTRMTATS